MTTVTLTHDPEANVWVAICDDPAIATEGETLIEVAEKVAGMIEEMRDDEPHTG